MAIDLREKNNYFFLIKNGKVYDEHKRNVKILKDYEDSTKYSILFNDKVIIPGGIVWDKVTLDGSPFDSQEEFETWAYENTGFNTASGGSGAGSVNSVTGDGVSGTPEDVVMTFPTPAEIGAEEDLGNPAEDGQVLTSTTAGVRSWVDLEGINFTTDESLYLDTSTKELRANVSDFSEKYTYTSGTQEFVLTDTPIKIIYISVNGQLLEDPLTQWSIDVPTKTITILDEMDSGDRVTVHYQYYIEI